MLSVPRRLPLAGLVGVATAACLPLHAPGLGVDAYGPPPESVRVSGGTGVLLPRPDDQDPNLVPDGVGAQVEVPVSERVGVVATSSVTVSGDVWTLSRAGARVRVTDDDASVAFAPIGFVTLALGEDDGLESAPGLAVGGVLTGETSGVRLSAGGTLGLMAYSSDVHVSGLTALRASVLLSDTLTLDLEPSLYIPLHPGESDGIRPGFVLSLSGDLRVR